MYRTIKGSKHVQTKRYCKIAIRMSVNKQNNPLAYLYTLPFRCKKEILHVIRIIYCLVILRY